MCDTTTRTEENTAYQGYTRESFADADRTLPFRLVGSYEYFRAVYRLDRLVGLSTPEQLEAYDRILAPRKEYAYYSGMATESMLADSLNPGNAEGRKQLDERFLRQGLAWMLALARIELAATVAYYGDHRIDQPLSVFPPGPHDREAWLAVLRDDLQAHLTNLATDPGYADVTKLRRPPDNWSLAYLRRFHFLTSMIRVLDSLGHADLSARLQPFEEELAASTKQIIRMIEMADTPVLISGTGPTSVNERLQAQEYIDRDCRAAAPPTESTEVRNLFGKSGSPPLTPGRLMATGTE